MTAKYRKKLIEVALPLEAINVASAREKSIRHGHPSTLHLWWARRPLAACRAVLFASLVNDPDDDPMYGINEETAATERANLFALIEELVQWENSNNPRVINAARLEIARSIAANKVADQELTDDTPLVASAPELPEEQAKYLPEPPAEYTPKDVRFKMPGLKPEQVNHFLAHYAPPVLDPFAGGGSIPLEAQRLGLRAYASDLNPVPVLINKALIEIPPKFAGMPPVNPDAQKGKLKSKQWQGAEGLAEDVRYYGKWMRDEAEKRIGHLYPKVKVTQQMVDDGRPDLEPYVGRELTVVAWLWALTVKSPNPAARGAHVPLFKSFWLSTKKNGDTWLEPKVNNGSYSLAVCTGDVTAGDRKRISAGTKLGRGCRFRCLLTNEPIAEEHIKAEGMAGNLGEKLAAIVVQGKNARTYVAPIAEHESLALSVDTSQSSEGIDAPIAEDKRALWCLLYGVNSFEKLFSRRQRLALSTFSDLLNDVGKLIKQHAKNCEMKGQADEYSSAVKTYLAFAINKAATRNSTQTTWYTERDSTMNAMSRQAIPMTWDYAEVNPLMEATGSVVATSDWVAKVLETSTYDDCVSGSVYQQDAATFQTSAKLLVSTDPPYYDNIGYADLSDFFYVWLRRSLSKVYPKLFGTLVTPKNEELIASPYRHGGSKQKAKIFFEKGLGNVFKNVRHSQLDEFPFTVFYAFKQADMVTVKGDSSTTVSTGWETMLDGLIKAGFAINGTWPVRTEQPHGLRVLDINALASSIVLACRPRGESASMVTRRDFANALRKELPEAIKHLQSGNVAPVDLAQASIGPGMAVFSRYSKVVNADGSPMSVREALQLINQVLDESLVEQESDFDSETRFALKWFEQYGMSEGPYGDAESLSKAMAVSVKGIEDAGILRSKSGKVRLLKRDELDSNWDPATDSRLTMWEVTQYLIRTLEQQGETGAADLLRKVGSEKGDIARELAYRLYQTCERKSLAKEAGSYNALVVSWPEISKLSRQAQRSAGQQSLELTE